VSTRPAFGSSAEVVAPVQGSNSASVSPLTRAVGPLTTVAAPALPGDPLFAEQWNLYGVAATPTVASSTSAPAAPAPVNIDVVPVWQMGFTGKGISIGLFDTAPDIHHPDLGIGRGPAE